MTTKFDNFSDEALRDLVKDAQAEIEERNTNRMSLTDLRRLCKQAYQEASISRLALVNGQLAKLGIHIVFIDGKLFLERNS